MGDLHVHIKSWSNMGHGIGKHMADIAPSVAQFRRWSKAGPNSTPNNTTLTEAAPGWPMPGQTWQDRPAWLVEYSVVRVCRARAQIGLSWPNFGANLVDGRSLAELDQVQSTLRQAWPKPGQPAAKQHQTSPQSGEIQDDASWKRANFDRSRLSLVELGRTSTEPGPNRSAIGPESGRTMA